MEKLASALEVFDDVEIVTMPSATKCVVKLVDFIFEVTVANEVLEWFVDVYDNSKTLIVQDWFDYQGYDDFSIIELESYLLSDVILFVEKVRTGKFRVKEQNCLWNKKKKYLEREEQNVWTQFLPQLTI